MIRCRHWYVVLLQLLLILGSGVLYGDAAWANRYGWRVIDRGGGECNGIDGVVLLIVAFG